MRCIDAHAHLGNLAFEHSPKKATGAALPERV
jgi:hypothetical protein